MFFSERFFVARKGGFTEGERFGGAAGGRDGRCEHLFAERLPIEAD